MRLDNMKHEGDIYKVVYFDIDTDGGQPFHSITEIGLDAGGELKIRIPIYGLHKQPKNFGKHLGKLHSPRNGLRKAMYWISSIEQEVVLVAHNAKHFDAIHLLRNLDKFNVPIPVALKFADSMDLIRRLKNAGQCKIFLLCILLSHIAFCKIPVPAQCEKCEILSHRNFFVESVL